jgi:hypothetical protein
VLVLLAAGTASGADGSLSRNSPLGQNPPEGGVRQATATLSGGTHRGCGDLKPQDAAGLFVAPINPQLQAAQQRIAGQIQTLIQQNRPASEVFQQIAQFRRELGLPAVRGVPDEPTVALLNINGRSFWGSSSANAPLEYQRFMAELARAQGHPQATWQALRHAEADTLIQAFNSGATTNARSAVLHVDRELCGWCSQRGGLDNLLRTIGLDEIRVVTPGNPQGIVIRASGR